MPVHQAGTTTAVTLSSISDTGPTVRRPPPSFQLANTPAVSNSSQSNHDILSQSTSYQNSGTASPGSYHSHLLGTYLPASGPFQSASSSYLPTQTSLEPLVVNPIESSVSKSYFQPQRQAQQQHPQQQLAYDRGWDFFPHAYPGRSFRTYVTSHNNNLMAFS